MTRQVAIKKVIPKSFHPLRGAAGAPMSPATLTNTGQDSSHLPKTCSRHELGLNHPSYYHTLLMSSLGFMGSGREKPGERWGKEGLALNWVSWYIFVIRLDSRNLLCFPFAFKHETTKLCWSTPLIPPLFLVDCEFSSWKREPSSPYSTDRSRSMCPRSCLQFPMLEAHFCPRYLFPEKPNSSIAVSGYKKIKKKETHPQLTFCTGSIIMVQGKKSILCFFNLASPSRNSSNKMQQNNTCREGSHPPYSLQF